MVARTKNKKSRPVSALDAARVRPLHDRVLVRRLEEKEQIRGGIIIPDTAKEKPHEAEVIAVGPGKVEEDGKRRPMDVRAGDRVLIGKYSGTDIKLDGEDLVILREDDIMAVVGAGRRPGKQS